MRSATVRSKQLKDSVTALCGTWLNCFAIAYLPRQTNYFWIDWLNVQALDWPEPDVALPELADPPKMVEVQCAEESLALYIQVELRWSRP